MDESVVRMDCQKWSLVASMFAVQARIEGMKAQNKISENTQDYTVYGETPFNEAEGELDALSKQLLEM